jgi:hypothetical protein
MSWPTYHSLTDGDLKAELCLSGAQSVKTVVRGIRRTNRPTRKAPATAELIDEMLKCCPETLAGTRDRALLAF